MNLKTELNRIKDQVEPIINDFLSRNVVERDQEIMVYQCKSGGKRIRPALVVLSGKLLGAKEEDLLNPAAAIEIIHNASLIADDIIDHSTFRRDEPTCWYKFGQSMAECAALDYMASAYEAIADHPRLSELTKLYSKAVKTVVDGEISDILFERSGREDDGFVVANRYKDITFEDYLTMVGQKTAALLQVCCQTGAICAGASQEQHDMVSQFGLKLGIAFQIQDDLLDIFGDEKQFGKQIGKDIIEKKLGNAVILIALVKLSENKQIIIKNILESPNQITDEDVKIVTELINSTDARQVAQNKAQNLIDEAMDLLSKLPQNEYANLLGQLAQYITKRNS